MKHLFSLLLVAILALVGCQSVNPIDQETEKFLQDYLTLRFESVNTINQPESDVDEVLAFNQQVEPFMTEEQYKEFVKHQLGKEPLITYDFIVHVGGEIEIETIELKEIDTNQYQYEVVALIHNPKELLHTTYSGLIQLDENGLIEKDEMNLLSHVTEVLSYHK